MSHTPAPWKFESSTKTIRSVPTNYWIATIDSFDGAVDHEANARLIAAAPALLEACKFAVECLKPKYTSDHIVMKKLNNAINQAKGA